MDYSKLSDEELLKLKAERDQKKTQVVDYSTLSDEELLKLKAERSQTSEPSLIDKIIQFDEEGPIGQKNVKGAIASMIGAKKPTGESIAERILIEPGAKLGELLGDTPEQIEKYKKTFEPIKQAGAFAVDVLTPGNIDWATLGISKLLKIGVESVDSAKKFSKVFGEKILKIPSGDLVTQGIKSEKFTKTKNVNNALKTMYKYGKDYFDPDKVKSIEDLAKRSFELSNKAEDILMKTAKGMGNVSVDNIQIYNKLLEIPELATSKNPTIKFVESLRKTIPDQADQIVDSLINGAPLNGEVAYNALKAASKSSPSKIGNITTVDTKIAREVRDLLQDLFKSRLGPEEFTKLNDYKNINAALEKTNIFKKAITKTDKAKNIELSLNPKNNLIPLAKKVKNFIKPENISKKAETLMSTPQNKFLKPKETLINTLDIVQPAIRLQRSSNAFERYMQQKQQNNPQ